jgi:NhaP-type Na+/H+ or K+/H+ antiporter
MHAVETVLLVLLLGALTGIVARYIRAIPLPLIQIALGALIAWPQAGLHIAFDPELFLLLFIPPLLFADGWRIPSVNSLRWPNPFCCWPWAWCCSPCWAWAISSTG